MKRILNTKITVLYDARVMWQRCKWRRRIIVSRPTVNFLVLEQGWIRMFVLVGCLWVKSQSMGKTLIGKRCCMIQELNQNDQALKANWPCQRQRLLHNTTVHVNATNSNVSRYDRWILIWVVRDQTGRSPRTGKWTLSLRFFIPVCKQSKQTCRANTCNLRSCKQICSQEEKKRKNMYLLSGLLYWTLFVTWCICRHQTCSPPHYNLPGDCLSGDSQTYVVDANPLA